MKRFFHQELEEFRSNLVLMGEKCIEIVQLALRALVEHDPALAAEVLRRDDAIDQLEKLIDAEAVRYISLRAPVAGELRLLMVGMKAGHDLERVGDEASSIAKRAKRLTQQVPVNDLRHIPVMATLALEMLRDAIHAFLEGDGERAKSILRRDRDVDDLNRQNFAAFSETMTRQPDKVGAYVELMWVSKSLERVADHATNIAEEVLYLLSGEDIRHTTTIKDLRRRGNEPLPR